MRPLTGWLAVAAVVLSGCGGGSGQRSLFAGGDMKVLRAPAGSAYLDALWRDSDHLLVAQLAGLKLRPRLGVVDVRTGAFKLLGTAFRQGCQPTGSSKPTSLGSRAIAYLSTCYGGDGTPDRINQIRRFDLTSGEDKPLFPYFVFPFTGRFTFSPDGRRGLLNDGDGLYEHLRWLLPTRTQTIALPRIARAGDPSWQPDGDKVVFDAVERGYRGDRAVAPRTLFVADATRLSQARALVRGMTDTIGVGVSWVPGRPWVICPMRPRGGPQGLWLIDLTTGAKLLLAAGSGFGRAAVAQDGRVAVPIGVDTASRGMTVRGGIELFRLSEKAVAQALAH